MKPNIWKQGAVACSTTLLAVSFMLAQAPAGQPANQAKGAAKGQAKAVDPAQSPASRPRPQSIDKQSYPAGQIKTGESRFGAQCGFCHGRDAEGGETGPDLTRSEIVAQDVHGDKIGPFVRAGRPDQGMPSFNAKALTDADLTAIVAFVHDQKTKSESESGGRRAVDDSDLSTGSVDAGLRYFSGGGGCSGCHSATGDLKGIATRYKGLALLQRMLYPTAGRPAPARPKVTVTLSNGQTVAGSLAADDEFTLTLLDAAGARQVYEKTLPYSNFAGAGQMSSFKIDDPMSAHFDLLGKYTDADMHNVFAYVNTLK